RQQRGDRGGHNCFQKVQRNERYRSREYAVQKAKTEVIGKPDNPNHVDDEEREQSRQRDSYRVAPSRCRTPTGHIASEQACDRECEKVSAAKAEQNSRAR